MQKCQFNSLEHAKKGGMQYSELMLTMVKHAFTASNCYISVVTHVPASSLSLAKTWKTLEQLSKVNLNKSTCAMHHSSQYCVSQYIAGHTCKRVSSVLWLKAHVAVVAVSLMRVPPTWDQPPRLPDESRINYAITTALKWFICHTLYS